MVNDTFCDDGAFCVLNSDLDEAEARIEKLEAALQRIALCNWPGLAPEIYIRADWMQQIAREALE